MPKYDFRCEPCDNPVEVHMTFDSLEKPLCQMCGLPMTKEFTPPSIHFKGGGWGGQG